MTKGKTFMRAEVCGLGGTDIEVKAVSPGTVQVDVSVNAHGLEQLNTLRQGIEDLRNRFPAWVVLDAEEKKADFDRQAERRRGGG